jgi:hypothetical protein
MVEVYAVHTVQPDEVRPVVIVCAGLDDAERWAAEASRDEGVLAAAVTKFTLDAPGTRRGVSLFVDGVQQARPYISDNRKINS